MPLTACVSGGLWPSLWAQMEGQDFMENHAVKDIDFATIHVWPDNWWGAATLNPAVPVPVLSSTVTSPQLPPA
jgi:hypothetical protein